MTRSIHSCFSSSKQSHMVSRWPGCLFKGSLFKHAYWECLSMHPNVHVGRRGKCIQAALMPVYLRDNCAEKSNLTSISYQKFVWCLSQNSIIGRACWILSDWITDIWCLLPTFSLPIERQAQKMIIVFVVCGPSCTNLDIKMPKYDINFWRATYYFSSFPPSIICEVKK